MTAMLTATFGTLVPTLMRLVALEPSLSPALMYADIQRLHAISAVLRMRDQLSWDDHELARRLHADDTSSLVGTGSPNRMVVFLINEREAIVSSLVRDRSA